MTYNTRTILGETRTSPSGVLVKPMSIAANVGGIPTQVSVYRLTNSAELRLEVVLDNGTHIVKKLFSLEEAMFFLKAVEEKRNIEISLIEGEHNYEKA